jgi:tetratricopeptide (TPR) repeat protein
MDILWLCLYASLAVLCAATFWTWLMLEPAARPRALACLLLAAVWLAAFHTTGAGRIPADWVTPMHEGTGRTDLLQLYGEAAHAGLNFGLVRRLWQGPGRRDLRGVVRMNAALAGLNACLYLLAAWSVLESLLPALGFALLFAANRNYVHAALSEVPGQLLTLYFLLGVLAAAVLRARGRIGAWRAWAAWLMLAALTLLAGRTRLETVMTGVLAAALGLARLARAAEDVRGDFLWRRLKGVLDWGAAGKALLLLFLAALSVRWWDAPERWTWVPDGLRPFNPSFVLLPAFLWDYLPGGLVLLTLAGLVHGVRNLGAFLGLPVSLLVLYRTYHSAGGASYCDMFRYATHWTPMALFLALFGWREIASLLGPKARRTALAVVLVLFLVPPGGPVHALYSGGKASREHRLWRGHNQEEVRFLLKAIDEAPDAVFVTRIASGWAFFGRPLPFVVFDEPGARTLGEELRGQKWLPRGRLLFYRGLDCSLEGAAQDCMERVPGARPVRELEFANPRLCDPSEYGEHTPRIRLGLYEFSLDRGESAPRCPTGTSPWDWLSLARLRLKAGDEEGGAAALECAASAGPDERDRAAIARHYGELRSDRRDKPARKPPAQGLFAGFARWLRSRPASPPAAPDVCSRVDQGEDLSGAEWIDLAQLAKGSGKESCGRRALERAESAGVEGSVAAKLARAYAEAGLPSRGLALARKAVSSGRLPARAWLDAAHAARVGGDRALASEAMERARKAGCTSREDKEESSLQYQELGEHGKALELLDGLIREEPGSGRLRSDRGVVKALLGRKEEAIADLREAVRLEPGLLEAYVSLGSLLAGSGRREEAREAYRLGLRRCGASAADKGMRRVLEAELARL